jgi:hypothetical protein
MDDLLNSYSDAKISSRQGIYMELKEIWDRGERLAKEANKLLGGDDPICENLGYANIGMMNAYFEIKGFVHKACSNKLQLKTVGQILDVLNRIKYTGVYFMQDLIEVFQKAVHDVGKSQGLERNTIADACCRRLQLNRDQFLNLVGRWLAGDPNSLVHILKAHTSWSMHNVIDDFFNEKRGVPS